MHMDGDRNFLLTMFNANKIPYQIKFKATTTLFLFFASVQSLVWYNHIHIITKEERTLAEERVSNCLDTFDPTLVTNIGQIIQS